MTRALRRPALALLGLALAGGPAAAQPLTLQRALPAGDVASCPAPGSRPTADTAAAGTAGAREEARRLGAAAATSMLAGETRQARDLLRRAVSLDPGATELAYRLARAHEDLGDVPAALAVYCGLRARAPDERAAVDAEERMRALVGREGAVPVDTVAQHFAAGVREFDGGDFPAADAAFTRAIAAAPGLAPAYYDRALARLARGELADAIVDLDRYARLAPGPDAGAVRALDVLRRGRRDPSGVLAAGLLPGGAQFSTGRPGTGALVALATAAGIYLALDGRAVFRQRTAIDPFGNPYQYTDPRPTQVHPRRGIGISLAGAALIGGAIEGFLRAREGRSAVDALRAGLRGSVARAPSAP